MTDTSRGLSNLTLGLVLVAVGAILFAGQLLGIGIGDIGWPFYVIAVGAILLVAGLVMAQTDGLIIGGTVVTTVGLVLLYQDRTGHWESWAYAWALVGPTAGGLGTVLWGTRRGKASTVRAGIWAMLGGLAMFGIGFLFFEGIIGISGERLALPPWLLPVAVIAVGVVILVRGLVERREG